MLTNERRAYIRTILARDGRVVAKSLSEELGLSEDTIRRDLRELAAEGLLQRVHGGALPTRPSILDFGARSSISTSVKQSLGRAAAKLVSPGQVVFIDGGTTNVQLARSLPETLEIVVVTHSPTIAMELVNHPRIAVELIGGRLFKHSVVTMGSSAAEAIGRFRPDIFFMGVTGVHPAAGLTTGDAEEASIKRAISHQSDHTIVLASSEKIGTASPFVIGPVSSSTTLVVEAGVEDAALEEFARAGMPIVNAD